MNSLTFVCITKGEPHAFDYLNLMRTAAILLDAKLLIASDGHAFDAGYEHHLADQWIYVESKGYIESVLDEVMGHVETDYVFRIDDDEHFSYSLIKWLKEGQYTEQQIWAFPRCNMWNETHFINERPLFPDQQTRLTTKQKALGWVQNTIHHGCPHGAGTVVPHAILHDKFIVKGYEQRKALADHYESIAEGGGHGAIYKPFQLPEDVYEEPHLWPVGDGYFPDWQALSGKGEKVCLERH